MGSTTKLELSNIDFASLFYMSLNPTLTYKQFCQFSENVQSLLLRKSIFKEKFILDSKECPKCNGRYDCEFQLISNEYGFFGRCSDALIDDVRLQPEQYKWYECDQAKLLSYLTNDITASGHLLGIALPFDQYVAFLGKLICKAGIYPLYFESNDGNGRIAAHSTPNQPCLVIIADLRNSKIEAGHYLYVPLSDVLNTNSCTLSLDKLEFFIQQHLDIFTGCPIPTPTSQKDFISTIEYILDHVEWVIRMKRGWELFEFKCEDLNSHNKEKIQKFVDEPKIQIFIDCILQSFLHQTPLKVIREHETGRGPVDFEISYKGFRTFLEVKKFVGDSLESGISNQLPQYLDAGLITSGVYLIINLNQNFSKKQIISNLQNSLSSICKEGKEIKIHVINAFPVKGASSEKRKNI